MPKPTLYLDSTIPSVYHDQRTDPERVRWRRITRAWWEHAHERYMLCSSLLIIEEISRGRQSDQVAARKSFAEGLSLLPLTPPVAEAARVYASRKLMPSKPLDDAVHLAAASLYGCKYLVSWNLKHLANPNKRAHLKTVNQELGLSVPVILTPEQLLEIEHEQS
ncbi:type II toxin-antitoxin system VapC family toxin [Longimicrobium terrae]|uniref:Putative nucleic acid-binding protein n=1 Tax=Longimicrobium terrae TaxID=1639882 RepID=A0A841H3J1_9BACT|nr:type II toxin-antitoxin system VapC family toxin [Longimicrobium terrae]MBB4638393.1 putative nucleic acid-binding protein [Longimicrobium terrae]MBB6072538.1 putative nucleic acid-binding protein [Longimicrobium terrae]NNC28681.1 type II toxin-antitoxin system VapC family toxin [Longimicrobium terrae]